MLLLLIVSGRGAPVALAWFRAHGVTWMVRPVWLAGGVCIARILLVPEHIEALLDAPDAGPLCFVVFVPRWRRNAGYIIGATSRHLRCLYVLDPQAHTYLIGAQVCCGRP